MANYSFFETVYSFADFVDASVTDVNDSEFSTVARLAPDKGEIVQFGQGQARSQTDAVGRAFIDVEAAGDADLEGIVRLVILNSQNNQTGVISQWTTGAVRVGENDRAARRPFSLQAEQIAEPYKIGVQVKLNDGTGTVDTAASSMELDGYRGEAMS